MNEKQKKTYLRKLMREKERIFQTLGLLEKAEKEVSGKEVGGVPTHIADLGTDVFEKALEMNLSDSERKILLEIDRAIEKINKGTYGVCEVCGKSIPRSRLEALPYARNCLACQVELEKKQSETY
ncbi:MAG: TraR/DksA C4-type zinc finger protein [Candidatus Omnitrophica bacterium]|nr:TraR/DksA C4-type zinc finger protein [Candidatus Omnitrophota bacterium]